jgi:class 3 adenylate cyclase
MEPRIQYAQTEDGVSIAFCEMGEGKPLVVMPRIPFSHVQLEWQWPEARRSYELLAEKRRVVRYDVRGTGMSARHAVDFALDSQMADLEAVVQRLGLDRLALYAPTNSGPAAIAYAARYPERVSHLILVSAWARASDWSQSPQLKALRGLLGRDWETYTETWAHMAYGWSRDEEARRAAALLRESLTQEAMLAWAETVRGFDVTDCLPQVRAPTLVVHDPELRVMDVGVARHLASQIPDARLVLLEGASILLPIGDMEAGRDAIDEFLHEGEEARELPEGMSAILFTDIVDSTALTEQLGDAAFRAKARELDALLRAIIRECGGTPVEGKVLGDGVLAVFTSARQAIECALRCNTAGESVGLQLHLGIHAGDVIREGNNVYGGAVNIAARIAGASAPGEVLVSDTVRGLARTSAGVGFEDRGEQTLKGVAEPQRLFAVREGGAS